MSDNHLYDHDDNNDINSTVVDHAAQQQQLPKQCFSVLQQRQFWNSTTTTTTHASSASGSNNNTVSSNDTGGGSFTTDAPKLCPTMDLMILGNAIYRTLTPQKLAHFQLGNNENEENPSSQQRPHRVIATFRPDGRYLAGVVVASHPKIRLYALEDMTNQESVDEIPIHCPVSSLSWVHMGKPHPFWRRTASNHTTTTADTNNNPYYNCLFPEETRLPPSQYHMDFHKRFHLSLLSPNAPLNLLCAIDTEHRLSLFIHGRYPIVQDLPLPNNNSHNHNHSKITASQDLTHIFIHTHTTHSSGEMIACTIYSLPMLVLHRNEFQSISAIYSNIQSHLHHMRDSLTDIAANYKAALRPLDQKLEALRTLLENYGLLSSSSLKDSTTSTATTTTTNDDTSSVSQFRYLLAQYLQSGQTRLSPDLSNAMDQFFTSVQLNDQLMLRLERSVENSLANIETLIRRNLVAPAIAIVYQLQTIQGLAKYRPEWFVPSTVKTVSSTPSSFLSEPVDRLVDSSHRLLAMCERALSDGILSARFRLRDWIRYLRGTAASIKARGTAPGSVQRENAMKRRIDDATRQRLMQIYLLAAPSSSSSSSSSRKQQQQHVGLTEALLALQFSELFLPSGDYSLSSVPSDDDSTIVSLPQMVADTEQIFQNVFVGPRNFMTQSVRRTEVRIPLSSLVPPKTRRRRVLMDYPPGIAADPVATTDVTVTTRVGQGNINLNDRRWGEEVPTGFFAPSAALAHVRQWSVLAHIEPESKQRITIYAFPLTWTCRYDDFDDDDVLDEDLWNANDAVPSGIEGNRYLTTQIEVPSDCRICKLAFYGDDGRSSLSSSNDDPGTGQEGRRQALGVLLYRTTKINAQRRPLELWIIPYDGLMYECRTFDQEPKRESNGLFPVLRCCRSGSTQNSECSPVFQVDPIPDDSQIDNGKAIDLNRRMVWARTRVLSSSIVDDALTMSIHLELSGSRGIGVVSVMQKGTAAALEVLDLEEDEEYDGDDDEMETDAD